MLPNSIPREESEMVNQNFDKRWQMNILNLLARIDLLLLMMNPWS